MPNLISIYLILLSLLALITIGISIFAFFNWQLPGARSLGFLMLAISIWAGSYALEISLATLADKIFFRKILYLGMSLSPPFWLWLSIRYTGIRSWWAERNRLGLIALPGVLSFSLGATNETHQLIWKSLSLDTKQVLAPLQVEYGVGFWVFTTIAYILIAIGMAVYFITHLKSEPMLRKKTGVMLLGASLVFLSNASFLLLDSKHTIDPTPLSFAVSAPLIAFGFFRYGAINLLPLAAPLIIENLQDAIVITNSEKEVTNINLAAKKMLNLPKVEKSISIFDVLPDTDSMRKIWESQNSIATVEHIMGGKPRTLEVRVIPIKAMEKIILGYVMVFHDITKLQTLLHIEKLRSKHLSLLEKTGRLIAGSLNENEILQIAADAITQIFNHPETAISLVTPDNKLKVSVISGTEDFGYRPGYLQEIGQGIIGYTASIQKTYVTGDVSRDPHYYSTSTQSGSAICIPIFKQSSLYGVLYVESFQLDAFGQEDVRTLETLVSQISESLQRAALFTQTQKDLRTIAITQNISKLVASSLDLNTISSIVVKSLQESFGYTHVSIYFLEEDYLHLSAQVGYPAELTLHKIHISQGVAGRCIRTKQVQFIQDARQENAFLKADHHILSEICVPLLKDGKVLGIVNIESTSLDRLTTYDEELLVAIAGPIAVSVDNARLHTEIKRMASTDAVTGLANRHIFEKAIAAEMERAQRHNTTLSLMIFDVDSFKEYNDTWGHPAGDARLKTIADTVTANLRKYDIAARYGGDEFAVIMTNCSQADAYNFATRLREGVRVGAPNEHPSEKGIPGYTLSIGIATYPQDANTLGELLIAADNASMRAKQSGKNRIKTASDT